MTDRVTTLRAEITPIVESLDLSVYDVTLTGGDRPTLAVLVSRAGGVDLELLETATRTISAALDALDPLPSKYLLEVSSPGLERPLRTVEHFAGAIGEVVTMKTRDDDGAAIRLRGTIASVDAGDAPTVTVTTDSGDRTVALDALDAARTVFEWGPSPKPGRGSRPGRKKEVAAR